MRAKSVAELQVWQRALKFAEAITAITTLPRVQKDIRLREQLDDSYDSMVSNIAEGFGQSSDRAFARYQSISKGSTLEAKTHLLLAVVRNHISRDHYDPLAREATEIARMLSALIRYLRGSDWKDRW